MTKSDLTINRLASTDADFRSRLDSLLQRDMLIGADVVTAVKDILQQVRDRGDAAVLDYSKRFDGFDVANLADLTVGKEQMQESLDQLPASHLEALQFSADRVRYFHEKQQQASWQYQEADGSVYGQKITPLDRVGVYVPGGKASYPSSMLMLAVPAQVAGVKEIIAVVPTVYSTQNSLIFAAAALAGVTRVYTIGGAQAIAALAFGTESVPKVDKIAGPGNIYVTVAKKLVFGEVGIDMIAGPSELTVICDGKTDPEWVAMDLFSQAEHDELAQSILISPDAGYIETVIESVRRLLPGMERQKVIAESLTNRGIFIQSESLEQAVEISNIIAPEHLELSVENPEELLAAVDHAGAIFLGRYTSEALGDYCAGPSHVLPTSGTARFFSGVSVHDFQKRSSIIRCSAEAADRLGRTTSTMARNESLEAHARSAELRFKQK
ncbi:MAG: histidinol dehydrogenase [Pseudohongiellaceae bacterium]